MQMHHLSSPCGLVRIQPIKGWGIPRGLSRVAGQGVVTKVKCPVLHALARSRADHVALRENRRLTTIHSVKQNDGLQSRYFGRNRLTLVVLKAYLWRYPLDHSIWIPQFSRTYQNQPFSKPWLQPTLLAQNRPISDLWEFYRNFSVEPRKQLEVQVQACRRCFRGFGAKRFLALTKIRHVQNHGLWPRLFAQNQPIPDPCEFNRNPHEQSRKQ